MSYWKKKDISSQKLNGASEEWWRFSNPIYFAIGLLVVIISIWIIWNLFRYDKVEIMTRVPVIRAEPGPTKIAPKTTRAPEIPHQEKLIYEQESEEKNKKEKLLSLPEKPVEKSPSMTDQFVDSFSSDMEENDEYSVIEFEEDYEPIEGQQDVEISAPSSKKLDVEKNNEVKYSAQIGTFESQEIAEQEWEKLKKLHPKVLSSYRPSFFKVDLGDYFKVMYQIRIGNFKTKFDAISFCKKISAPCVVKVLN